MPLVKKITGINVSERQVTGLETGVEYEFHVVSVRDGIESADSNHVTATPEVQFTILAPPFNLSVTPGDTIIDASVDEYPVTVESYNWYLDGVLIDTTADGTASFQFTGLTNEQEYLVGVSVTVAGVESEVLNWTNHTYDTNDLGAPVNVVTGHNNYSPRNIFYSGTFNRTYFLWRSNESPTRNYIFYYDHDTGSISASVLVHESTATDHHINAVLEFDSLGNLYVVVEESHNGNYAVIKSDSPEDISSWTQINTLTGNLAYPKMFIDDSDDIYITARDNFGTIKVFKSTDSGVSFTSNTLVDTGQTGSGADRWGYHGRMYSGKNQGFHMFINLQDRTVAEQEYPDVFYLYSPDGITWGNIEYFESGGASGVSRNISTGAALSVAEIEADFSVIIGTDRDSINYVRAGVLFNGSPVMIMGQGDEDNVPDLTSWNFVLRDGGAWSFRDISSITDLGDFDDAVGLLDMSITPGGQIKVWSTENIGGVNEVTEYVSDDLGQSWFTSRYLTRNGVGLDSKRFVSTFNGEQAPEDIQAWDYPVDGAHSDIRTSIKVPANATPVEDTENTHSLSFDGNDWVNIGDVHDINNSSQTWICHYKTPDFLDGAAFRIIDKRGQGGFGSAAGMQLSGSKSSAGQPTEWRNTALEDVSGNFVGGGNFNVDLPQDNGWHSIALVWDNSTGTLSIYVDEVLVASDTNASMIGANCSTSRALEFGRANTNAQYFNGGIDEVQVWGKALSLAEIEEFSGKTLEGTETDLLGYWKFNEGSGAVAEDGTVNNNDGTINGATYSTDTPF